ncbi:pentatricopeptide repeat-containing protein At4g21065-like [Malania oleifera]|uniref:pentatricopeptide repeat-containing protein At4g21065-like n=1 Tax=Malania oleifera TaxID=397392 RepID=UPI0025AE3321|nr:pentatricopeptide repeat-containing protein At4g21065-like [Malania oleifera]
MANKLFDTSDVTRLPSTIEVSGTSISGPHRWPERLHLPLLKKCAHLNQFKQLHTRIIKTPFEHTDAHLTKLIKSLVDTAQMAYAHRVFDQMPEPPTFVFNTMVRGYAEHCPSKEGIRVFVQMRSRGLEPDNYTYPFVLKACRKLDEGKIVHSLIAKSKKFSSDTHSLTSLVRFYCSCGDIESARLLFDRMPERDVVTWTTMIAGCTKQGRYGEGLALFQDMQVSGVEANELTLVSVLSACAHLGAYEMGKWVHCYINKKQIVLNPTLSAALIDLYVKCGCIEKASQIFQETPQRSVSTWNSMIGGLAMHGFGLEALEKFEQMQMSGTKPDSITLIGVLSACTHSGLVEEGKEYFRSMRSRFGIEPSIKHYGCLVDLLCRAGHLHEAYEVMKNMPREPNGVLWGTLLNACEANGQIDVAEIAMERLLELEPVNDGNYVLMSKIYAMNGQWDGVARMRRFMKDRRIVKNPGCSLIEIDDGVHEFMVGDGRHPSSKLIYSMLEFITMSLREEGYASS